MTGALYPRAMSEHGPCRSLADVQRELRARRLALLNRQLDAEAVGELGFAEWCGQEIAAVTRRLRMIDDAARG
jgi:hypothetical protein